MTGLYNKIINSLPGVASPAKRLTFKQRLMWTGGILLIFFILGQVQLYGVDINAVANFGVLQQIMASTMGSLITLGIGPIVTASIILQLLVGSGMIPWNLQTAEGRATFQGTQKLLAILFCIFEAFAYVKFRAIPPANDSLSMFIILVAQIAFGGFLILLMDETVSKWGIGSGISLFIAGGVTRRIFVRSFSPFAAEAGGYAAGVVPRFFMFLRDGLTHQAIYTILPLIATALVFGIVVYAQNIKVEIPLAFGSFTGLGRRWPLKFIYTSNIPVILTAALLANLRLVGGMIAKPAAEGLRCGIMGCFNENNAPVSGLLFYLSSPGNTPSIQVFFLTFGIIFFLGLLAAVLIFKQRQKTIILASAIAGIILSFISMYYFAGMPDIRSIIRILTYLTFMMAGASLFSLFWMETSGMDAHSVATQIQGIGMQIPGFRRDPRIVEKVLSRYILPLTIMGALFVGAIAAFADFTNALGSGTGILLTAMIIFNFYEQVSAKYMEDMNPALRKFLGSS